VALMSDHENTTPDGSTNISDEEKARTEQLADGSKEGLVDDDKDESADKA